MQFYGLRLEPSLKKKIELEAKKANMGFSEWVRQVLRQSLDGKK
jgi:predicted HicB family RNase H-like nuclease